MVLVANNAEVGQCCCAVGLEEDVLWLEVAMYLTAAVQGIKAVENVVANPHLASLCFAHEVGQVSTWTELHDDEWVATHLTIVL